MIPGAPFPIMAQTMSMSLLLDPGLYQPLITTVTQDGSGTSMACPMVSGLAALIMTMRDGMSAQEIRELIEANVRVKAEYATFVSSSGLIDVGKTIKALKGNDGNAPGNEYIIIK